MWRSISLIRSVRLAALLSLLVLALVRPDSTLAAVEPAAGASGGATPAIIAPDCPVGAEQLSTSGGLAVCVDRGEGATYVEGDRISVCVAANIPTIAIYPPPPPPTIKVESQVDGGSSRVLLEDRFTDGHRCMSGTIVAPFGSETVRAQAIRADGTVFLEDSVTFTTRPR